MQYKKTQMKILSGVLALSFLALTGCTASDVANIVSNGNATSSTNSKLAPTNPTQVKLYYAGNPKPKHYKIIGRVSAEIYNVVGLEHTQASIADELKTQAASIGANGVININSGMAQVTGDAVIIK